MTIDKTIRDLEKQIIIKEKELEELFNKKLDLQDNCEHEHCLTVRGYYKGSYSMDYDDWEYEARICLSCGLYESEDQNNFKKLKNPIGRWLGFNDRKVLNIDKIDLLKQVTLEPFKHI